jgi:hypothetical protein
VPIRNLTEEHRKESVPTVGVRASPDQKPVPLSGPHRIRSLSPYRSLHRTERRPVPLSAAGGERPKESVPSVGVRAPPIKSLPPCRGPCGASKDLSLDRASRRKSRVQSSTTEGSSPRATC